jgi:hypothetical protein
MMPVIRISDATWERMKLHARPLEDTPDDIVRRALDALEGRIAKPEPKKTIGRPAKSAAGKKLPQKEFREPLLRTLGAIGGGGTVDEIRKALYPRIRDRLADADYARVTTGEERWWNAACWERSELVKDGLFRSDSPRGYWELSDEGHEKLRSMKTMPHEA